MEEAQAAGELQTFISVGSAAEYAAAACCIVLIPTTCSGIPTGELQNDSSGEKLGERGKQNMGQS